MLAARRFLEDSIEEKKRQLQSVLDGDAPTRGMDSLPPQSAPADVLPFRNTADAPVMEQPSVVQPLATRGAVTMPATNMAPLPEPVASPEMIATRVDTSGMGAPPPAIYRNEKGRPTGVMRGQDPLTEDLSLLKAERDYKAPHSTKDLLKSLATGFIAGGLPGLATRGLDYELSQPTRNRMAVGSDMAQTQQNIAQEIATRNQANDLANDESQRNYRDAQAERLANPTRPGFNISPGQTRMEIDPTTGRPVAVASLPDRALRTTPHNPLLRERRNADGSTTVLQSDDYGQTYHEAPNLGSAAPPEPVDTLGYQTDKQNFERKSKARSILAESDALKGAADSIHQKLQPVYEERNRVKARYESANQAFVADTKDVTAKAQRESLSSELARLNAQIHSMEQDRDGKYTQAGIKRSQAEEYSKDLPPPPARATRGPGGQQKRYKVPARFLQ